MARRVFSRSEDHPPYPVYTNAIEFSGLGMDMFMDVGVVDPEAVSAAIQDKPENGVPTVNVLVNFRFGMSLHTAAAMHQKLGELLKQSSAKLQEAARQPEEVSEEHRE
jgi:hypothetical protein